MHSGLKRKRNEISNSEVVPVERRFYLFSEKMAFEIGVDGEVVDVDGCDKLYILADAKAVAKLTEAHASRISAAYKRWLTLNRPEVERPEDKKARIDDEVAQTEMSPSIQGTEVGTESASGAFSIDNTTCAVSSPAWSDEAHNCRSTNASVESIEPMIYGCFAPIAPEDCSPEEKSLMRPMPRMAAAFYPADTHVQVCGKQESVQIC